MVDNRIMSTKGDRTCALNSGQKRERAKMMTMTMTKLMMITMVAMTMTITIMTTIVMTMAILITMTITMMTMIAMTMMMMTILMTITKTMMIMVTTTMAMTILMTVMIALMMTIATTMTMIMIDYNRNGVKPKTDNIYFKNSFVNCMKKLKRHFPLLRKLNNVMTWFFVPQYFQNNQGLSHGQIGLYLIYDSNYLRHKEIGKSCLLECLLLR